MQRVFQIQCSGKTIGISSLKERDEGMGVVVGEFVPYESYENVRAVFSLFADAQSDTGPADQTLLAEYYRRRDELELQVIDPDGVVVPTSTVHIADFSELGEDCYEVEVHIAEAEWFARNKP